MEQAQQILEIVTSVIGVASIFSALLPPQVSGPLLVLKKAIDMGAFNFLHAKNAEK